MENLSNMLRERRKIQIWFYVYEVSKQAKLIVMIEVRDCLWCHGGAFYHDGKVLYHDLSCGYMNVYIIKFFLLYT